MGTEKPHIEKIHPGAAIAGGEVAVRGRGLAVNGRSRPVVRFGDRVASLLLASPSRLIVRVPEGATSGDLTVETDGVVSPPMPVAVGMTIAENLHPVANPALDAAGNIFATFSGSRGQKVAVSVYKIDPKHVSRPFIKDLMNATGLAVDGDGILYVSSRMEGTVYQVTPDGVSSTYAEGMGVATGIAFDRRQNLYVGDRNGTIFKIAPDHQIFVFATLEPSVSAYHLAFGPHGDLFVTGPTTSSFDCVYKIDPHGSVSVFYRGLGRPQGLAFDADGNLYVAASLTGKRGIVKINPQGQANLEVSGHGLVGLAFAPGKSAVLATNGAVHHISWNIQGLPLLEP